VPTLRDAPTPDEAPDHRAVPRPRRLFWQSAASAPELGLDARVENSKGMVEKRKVPRYVWRISVRPQRTAATADTRT